MSATKKTDANLAELRKKTKSKKVNEVGATGRRKTSTARVTLARGSGFEINGKSFEKEFAEGYHLTQKILSPFATLSDDIKSEISQYKIIIKVKGGGPSGQAGAIAHALSIALTKMEEAELGEPEQGQPHPIRAKLKKAGLLTRDARKVERKKFGRKKARKGEQYSKR